MDRKEANSQKKSEEKDEDVPPSLFGRGKEKGERQNRYEKARRRMDAENQIAAEDESEQSIE